MKVIAIMGSPHKGKGYELIKRIESEMKLLGNVEFEYVFLSDVNLEMCKGCFNCISKGAEFCPIKDHKESIERKLLSSDGIILSSPGYAWNVSGLMKNFIDRFAYTMHRPEFFNQSLMLVANGGSGLNNVLKELSFTLGGSDKVCELAITTTPWETNKDYEKSINRNIRRSAKKFYDSLESRKEKSPKLPDLIWFKMFKKMSNLSKETLPADYKYYSDKSRYFYEVKINPIKSLISDFIATVGVIVIKKRIIFK
ncbi:NAD(P)H-dependent oxidoreductase [Inconstantimicrobium mannanitabidum]|uniref:Uncharacterized protein n=1 Tax=Inconstantimicrobium mannanitabidum TaxID=1604901 RepID=A0ACB5RFY4_9CLOT|nr:flavodoxin family protein [Clostridium sp. TW13]GKX67998.1 hypothetical protein rsdtw13_32560 [Clostridium sp. TW13]